MKEKLKECPFREKPGQLGYGCGFGNHLCFCSNQVYDRLEGKERLDKHIERKEKDILRINTLEKHIERIESNSCHIDSNLNENLIKCNVFKELNRIYKSILNNTFKDYLKIQWMMDNDKENCVIHFIESVAKDYFILHYRDKCIDKFIKRFRENMGIALAAKCIENESCPYLSIAKDVIYKRNSEDG